MGFYTQSWIDKTNSIAIKYGWSGVYNGTIDASRHAYTSAMMTMKYGESVAQLLGYLNEIEHINDPNLSDEVNMDFFNNAVGREIGKDASSEEEIIERLVEAIEDGRLITDLSDPREYEGDYPVASEEEIEDQLNEIGVPFPDEPYPDSTDDTSSITTPCCADAMDLARNYLMEGMDTVTHTPIALDLDGDGLEIVALADSNAFFDLDVDGFRENVQWLSGDDGFLALDANANGRIDDNTELFGDADGHANGWDKLATLDSNSDGVIDANDAAWSDLLVWRDLDGDGFTDDGELFTLDELGITSISLDADADLTSTYTTVGGDTLEATDLFFEQDQMLTVYGGEVDLDPEVLFLPWLRGYGEVADLPIAMSLDAELKAMVVDMVHIEDAGELYAAVEDLLAKWAGADGIDPEAMRGHLRVERMATV